MNSKTNKNRGDRKAQRKRRRKNLKESKPSEFFYQCIDGNWSNRCVGYCHRYHGALTVGLMKCHRCKERNCHRLEEGAGFD